MTFLAEQGMSLYFRGLAALVIADSAYVLRHGVMVTQGTPGRAPARGAAIPGVSRRLINGVRALARGEVGTVSLCGLMAGLLNTLHSQRPSK